MRWCNCMRRALCKMRSWFPKSRCTWSVSSSEKKKHKFTPENLHSPRHPMYALQLTIIITKKFSSELFKGRLMAQSFAHHNSVQSIISNFICSLFFILSQLLRNPWWKLKVANSLYSTLQQLKRQYTLSSRDRLFKDGAGIGSKNLAKKIKSTSLID